MTRISDAERRRLFGQPGQVRYRVVTTPWGVRCSAHEKIADLFLVGCRRAAQKSRWTPQRIDSYVHRQVRGSSATSLHSWALAFDFFSTPPNVPPPGGVWHPDDTIPPEFASAFEELGFTWGAKFQYRQDYPHIEWASAPPSTHHYQGQGSTTDARHNEEDEVTYLLLPPVGWKNPESGRVEDGNVLITNDITARHVNDTAEFDRLKQKYGAPVRDLAQLYDDLWAVRVK